MKVIVAGSRGTEDMITRARAKRLDVHVFYVNAD